MFKKFFLSVAFILQAGSLQASTQEAVCPIWDEVIQLLVQSSADEDDPVVVANTTKRKRFASDVDSKIRKRVVERNRRAKVAKSFSDLRIALSLEPKASKQLTLDTAIDEIKSLRRQVRALRQYLGK